MGEAASLPAGLRNAPDPELLLDMFGKMVLVRRMEERLGELHKQGRTRGPIHRCDGQEAVGIGGTAPLRATDTVTSTHRGHAHYVGKGLDPHRIVAEIFGRATGYSRGKAGHMLIADVEQGMVGGNAIVGAGIPLALGQALAHQLHGCGEVAVTFFGDGAAQAGICHEAMNMAGLWKLPIVFICEHNEYGLTAHARYQSAVEDLVVRAAGYNMPGVKIDGNDVLQVYDTVSEAVERARAGEGPTFIEAKTYRLVGFSTSDMGGYQPQDEIDAWRPRDPILRTRKLLLDLTGEARVRQAEEEAVAACDSAFEQALSDPLPDAAEADVPEFVETH
ncbi:thiamine pyrophosphate-dependent dehydrogenase E1 component subunit alpha [Rhodoligotrophos defluvii]|uniref:thiamine pyrophosphate-dependent dehydrogenase E1 component subunit alpha n=1 Tax=Rhodoligotrophos defluvii TaxID=2561934 RepID=UPI0010C9B111|nr:thiamine pyrophosphate-dependent dehydrogenase E1 component subunit alpha [Rhodoligotrophos defluvii]